MEREYNYIKGNTATSPTKQYAIPKRRKQTQQSNNGKRKKRKLYDVNKETRRGVVQIVLVMTVLGMFTIARYGKIYNMQNNFLDIRGEIKVATDIGEGLKVDLLKYASLDSIKSKAENKLGMKTPDKSNNIELNIKKNYFENLTKDHNNSDDNKSIFSKIKDALIN